MEYRTVDSSNIEAVGFLDGTLGIKFHSGAVYHYANVNENEFNKILASASVGRTFNELIKSKPEEYPYTRVA